MPYGASRFPDDFQNLARLGLGGGGGSFRQVGNQITMLPSLNLGAGGPAASVPPPAIPRAAAPAMPAVTNMSPYFAKETPDNYTGSEVGGIPFEMGPGTAWPFGASWASILGNG